MRVQAGVVHESQLHAHADRRAGHRRAKAPPARFKPRNPATSSSPFRPRSSPTSPRVMASIARAQSLDAARTLETQAQAQAQTQNFLNYGSGYQPGSAQMFH